MNTELKKCLSKQKTLFTISFLCILFGAFCCVIGDLLLPLVIGMLAAIYLFDTDKGRRFAIGVSVVLLVMNIAVFITKTSITFFAPAAVLISFLIFLSFKKGDSKADTALISTVIISVFTLLSLILLGMVEGAEYTIDAALSFYKELSDSIRLQFVEAMSRAYQIMEVEVSEEAIGLVYDLQVRMLPSILLIGGFITTGLSMKLFGFAVGKCCEDRKHIDSWRFMLTSISGYLYLILAIASMFLNDPDSLLTISVLNLYNVFLVVFAYVGFNFVYALLRMKFSGAVSLIILAGAMVIFFSFAVQLLSYAGVMFTLRRNREPIDPSNA